MAIEYEIRNGALLWIRNPFTGVVSYVVDLRGKSFAFTLGGRDDLRPSAVALDARQINSAIAACPFCPGNEDRSPPELFRRSVAELHESSAPSAHDGQPWVIRAFNNLFPRIPAELTAGSNESYVVVEDPRHFIERPHSIKDLLFTGMLSETHFAALLEADCEVMRRMSANASVRSTVIRKNQGRESGASQPHVHQQIIGAPAALPVIAAEARAQRENPSLWGELIELFDGLGLVIDRGDGIVSYASPIGAFPRSYDVVMPEFRGQMSELSSAQLHPFARALHRLLKVLGPLPLDYEIHHGEGLPLHAHLNARLYPYSNVAGTLNVPQTLLETAAAIRKALARGGAERA